MDFDSLRGTLRLVLEALLHVSTDSNSQLAISVPDLDTAGLLGPQNEHKIVGTEAWKRVMHTPRVCNMLQFSQLVS